MNSGINANDPTVVAAFRAALEHQGLIALLIFAVLALIYAGVRARPAAKLAPPAIKPRRPDIPALTLLRAGFGILWLFDGILQAQPEMAAGLPSKVIEPMAASSPAWVQHVVNWAGTSWSYHPIQTATAVVWIQVGIGIWLLAAPRGWWTRAAGLASVAWGLLVWVFGESFGGIFAPGATWLFGTPGAALFYCAAGVLIALPPVMWRTPKPGRVILTGMGAFFAAMAVLQAWPGRGFWQGAVQGTPGPLAEMTGSMAQTSQPASLAAWITAFTAFDEAHGFAVNAFIVVALGLIGVALASGWRRVLGVVVAAAIVVCLAAWVLVQDMGIFGGLGTDPNSMIPMVLVLVAGYLALTRQTGPASVPAAGLSTADVPALADVPAPAGAAGAADSGPSRWRERLWPVRLRQAMATATAGSVASAGALGLILLGAAPMAAAQTNSSAAPILAQSIAGSVARMDYPARAFRLTDQNGRTVTLASLRGKVVLMTFLDPVCTSACPVIAQEFRAADQLLSPSVRRHVVLVGIAANPFFYQREYVRAFTRQEHLGALPNWRFLTGSLPQLRHMWKSYGIAADIEPGGAMVGHTEVAYVIDQSGHVREEFEDDPGPGTAVTKASFSGMLASAARHYAGQP